MPLKSNSHSMTSFCTTLKKEASLGNNSHIITIPHRLEEMTVALSLHTTGVKQLKMENEKINASLVLRPSKMQRLGRGPDVREALFKINYNRSDLCHMGGDRSQKSLLKKYLLIPLSPSGNSIADG